MGISDKTLDVIRDNSSKFTKELQDSIQKLIWLAQEFSPLSDINFLMTKGNEKIPGVIISTPSKYWVPIRNVIRIVGKIAASSPIEMGKIQELEIESMFSGCDYFNGALTCTSDTGKQNKGDYKWQWSSFPGFEKNYDKFTLFPQNWVETQKIRNKNKITA